MNKTDTEDLRAVAAVKREAENKVERFYNRAPFIYTILLAVGTVLVVGAAWVTTIRGTVNAHDRYIEQEKSENLTEQVHTNGRDTRDARARVRRLEQKVFNLPPDAPGE
jgi:hypothetical protein